MDMPGYHPVQNPNLNPFGMNELVEDPTPRSVPAPATFPMKRNRQGLCGFMIPAGRGPAWEQQLCDTLQAQY